MRWRKAEGAKMWRQLLPACLSYAPAEAQQREMQYAAHSTTRSSC